MMTQNQVHSITQTSHLEETVFIDQTHTYLLLERVKQHHQKEESKCLQGLEKQSQLLII